MIPALLTAGAALAGAGLGYIGGERANEANARQAQLNRDFQERMRATQYQTAVDDMRKAGLNPALAYQQGGAGTPPGSTAQMGNSLAAAGGGAAQAAQTFANVEATMAQIEKTQAETARTRAETETIRPLAGAQGGMWEAMQGLTDAQRRRVLSEDEKGYVTAHLEEIRARIAAGLSNAREQTARAAITELDEARARNVFSSQSSWWKKYVSPYLHDAASAARIIPR